MNAHARFGNGASEARKRIEAAARSRGIVDPEAARVRRDDFPKAVLVNDREDDMAAARQRDAAAAAEKAARAAEAKALAEAAPEPKPADLFTALLATVEPPALPEGPVRVRLADVRDAACAVYQIAEMDIVSARRTKDVTHARQVAMYVCKVLTPRSLPDIGRAFGNRDHTTALHAIRKTAAAIREDDELSERVDMVRRVALGIASGAIRRRVSERKGVAG